MKSFKRGEKGFTLIELLIVVAILGVLAAVVIPNVVGLMGRGGKQAYNTDSEVIQLATTAFYADTHSGFDVGSGSPLTSRWGDGLPNSDPGNVTANNFYPDAIGYFAGHHILLSTTETDTAQVSEKNYQLVWDDGVTAVTDAQIQDAAIWMGLLVNTPGDKTYASGNTTRGLGISVVLNETGLYLQKVPKSSSSAYNGNIAPGGGYTWVVGKNGTVYGAYTTGTNVWYCGFKGTYP